MPREFPNSIELGAQHRHGAGYRVAEAAAVMAGGILLDSVAGFYREFRDSMDQDKALPDPFIGGLKGSKRAILLTVGCDQNGMAEGLKAEENFGDFARIISLVYDEREISPAALADQAVDAFDDQDIEEVVVAGGSMGLGIALQIADQPRFRERFPKVRGIIGIAGVTHRNDVAPGALHALKTAEVTGHSEVIDKSYTPVVSHLPSEPLKIGLWSIDFSKLPAMRPRQFIRYGRVISEYMPDGALAGLVDPGNAWYIDNLNKIGYQDKVVYTKRGLRNMGRILDIEVQPVEDPEHPAGRHVASLSRYPVIPRQLLLGAFNPDYRLSREYLAAIHPNAERPTELRRAS